MGAVTKEGQEAAAAPEGKPRELVELAQRRSPVCDVVSDPVPVEVRLK